MAVFKRSIQSIWWLLLAYAPIAIFHATDRIYVEIGCPPRGDCYVAGAIGVFELEILTYLIALLVWPACIWFLGGRLAAVQLGLVSPPNNSFKPSPHQGGA